MTTLTSVMFRPPPLHRQATPLLARTGLTSKELRLAILLLTVALLSFIDLLFTLFANRIGILYEMNPIAFSYLSQGLEPSLICYKILMVLAGSTMLWRVRHSKLALPAAWALVIVHVILAAIWYIWVRDINTAYDIMLTGPHQNLLSIQAAK